MKRFSTRLTIAFLVLCLMPAVVFALDFPPLTGRVVDQAGVMSAASRSDIEAKSKELEDKSGIQLVVATVKSLQGSDIETYANELFRFWKLGEAKKNNGVLLLVAPAEHKVRIEVGYGLEGTLTDALSSVIISSAIVPRFKANDYSGGIQRGVEGIIAVLTTDASEWRQKADVRADEFIGRFQQTVSDLVSRAADLFHLVPDPSSEWSGLRPRRYGPSTRSDHRSALGRLLGLGLGRRLLRRRFWRWFFRWRRLVGRWRGVGELVMEFSKEDHEAVSAAIQQAEKRTSGQIVCVLAHASSDYAHIPILWATALALIAPWPLINFTPWSVQRIFLIQLVVFIVAALVFSLTPLRFALVPRGVRRARAHRAALEQFVVRRIAATKNRCGILIFVSLAERYARIIADDGIAQKVQASEWQAAIDALSGNMRAGHIAQGFAAAIERCGTVLATHAPPDGSPNALPDRLYVM